MPGRGPFLAEAFGDAAVLVSGMDAPEVPAYAAHLRALGRDEVRDVVEGLRSVLVTVNPAVTRPAELGTWLSRVELPRPAASQGAEVTVPVRFGGPDSADVCRAVGVGPEELETLLVSATLRVTAIGFSPGFPYLEGLPPPLDRVPRRDRPRTAVRAGSVALGGGFAGIYPQPTPGGWQLVGWTPTALFDPFEPPFARLHPGDRVRLTRMPEHGTGPVHEVATEAGRWWGRPAWAGTSSGQGGFVVEDPGTFCLVEDAGRTGTRHLGVPVAGPADALAHALANRLVGNDVGAAAVEAVGRGPVLRALDDLFVAVVGGGPAVLVDGRPVGAAHVVPVASGQRCEIGIVRGGARTYVAVRGGVDAPSVLGSVSTDVLTRLGPGPLVRGDRIGVSGSGGPMADHVAAAALAAMEPERSGGTSRWLLRVLPAPWAVSGGDVGADELVDRLSAATHRVDSSSDRVGVRLRADPAAALGPVSGPAFSHGMVAGAVQLPPNGTPIVLGPDHATLGGYPVVAVVAGADLWKLGQCCPGDEVSMEPVSHEDAHRALVAARRFVETATAGRYPRAAGA